MALEIIWLSDLHLNVLDPSEREILYNQLSLSDDKYCLVSGDIADGRKSLSYLHELQEKSKKELFFVLGNHDFYGESIDTMKSLAARFSKAQPKIHYLTGRDPIALSAEVAVVGHDGWADGGAGDFHNSHVILRDYREIIDFAGTSREELFSKLQELGHDAANEARKSLSDAMAHFPNVIFLTHAPPYREACLHNGTPSDDTWAPHFVCQAMGQMLKEVAVSYPKSSCLVLAGHSHHEAELTVLENLKVQVSSSDYGKPQIDTIII